MEFVQYAIKGSISIIADTMIYWIFLNGIFERKRKGWKNGFVLSMYALSILALSYLGTFGLPSSIKLIVLVFVGIGVTKLLFHALWKNIAVYVGIYFFCVAVSDSLAMGILSISHGTVNLVDLFSSYVIVIQGMILSKIITFMLALVFIKRFGKGTNRYSVLEVCILLLQGVSGVACILMVIEFSYYKVSTYKVSSIYLIFVSLLILASYVVFYSIFENYVRKRNVEQEAMKIQFYNQGQYDYYEAMEKENINIRKMHHDLKNHLLAIQRLSVEDTASSEIYIQKCLEAVDGYSEFYDTGNQLADIIFYEKCSTAKISNIKTKVMVQRNSLNDIEMLDLCAILTNSFDNALEACKQCVGERYIQIKAIRNEAAVIITVKNNYDQEPVMNEKGDLITSKKEKAKHGIGMQSLKMAAEKYNGNVEIDIDREKKEFLLIIMIPVTYQNTL
ncbi:ATP-binding protein [Konateibacter massiliensis]|uniref:ATP-binding protein n=1 Tax=Konateibacter massiliensis TaxID=2002841 RepID=UPI000C157A8F|nr:ATP-binding protein [Konateibacter massiliensis]